MARGTAEVHQPPFGQHEHRVARGERVAIHLRLDLDLLDPLGVVEPGDVDLEIEVPDVADDGVVLHLLDVLAADHVAAAGGRHEDLAPRSDLFHGGHFIALHRRLQGIDGIDLRHHHPGPQRLHGVGRALADVAVTAHHHHLAGHHHVGGPLDAVSQALAAAVEVVELALGAGVVDVDRGELQLAVLVHLVEAVHARGRLLGEAADAAQQFRILLVHHRRQVAAVVEDHVEGLAVREEQRLLDAPVELLVGHALPGVDREARLGDRGRGMVLGREDVAAAPGDLGAEFLEGLDQHGRLDRHMEAAGDAGSSERLRATVLLAEGHQARHLVLGEHDLLAAPVGKRKIGDFVRQTGFDVGHGNLLRGMRHASVRRASY